MDPNECLREIRELKMRLLAQDDNEEPHDPIDVARLLELVEALDGWITAGGFLPEAWKKGSN